MKEIRLMNKEVKTDWSSAFHFEDTGIDTL